MEDELTPIEQSRADTGKRFYKIQPGFYQGLATAMDAKKNRPTGVGSRAVTWREIPLLDDAPRSADGTLILLAYDVWRMTPEQFDDVFNPRNPQVQEITVDEWEALRPAASQV